MNEAHEEGCPARDSDTATCSGCPYGVRLSAYLTETRRKGAERCYTCGTMHVTNTGVIGECSLCMRARNENLAVGETRIFDIRLVRLREGNWHVTIDGELVGEARGPGSALMMVRDWMLEAKR